MRRWLCSIENYVSIISTNIAQNSIIRTYTMHAQWHHLEYYFYSNSKIRAKINYTLANGLDEKLLWYQKLLVPLGYISMHSYVIYSFFCDIFFNFGAFVIERKRISYDITLSPAYLSLHSPASRKCDL